MNIIEKILKDDNFKLFLYNERYDVWYKYLREYDIKTFIIDNLNYIPFVIYYFDRNELYVNKLVDGEIKIISKKIVHNDQFNKEYAFVETKIGKTVNLTDEEINLYRIKKLIDNT